MIMITANVHLKAFYHGHIERMKKKNTNQNHFNFFSQNRCRKSVKN